MGKDEALAENAPSRNAGDEKPLTPVPAAAIHELGTSGVVFMRGVLD